jgi:hypothetical protein
LRADGAALASINVLAQASDPDGDKLTVTIEQTPLIGTATVNADGSVSITGLPASFKGMTRFEYRVTDPSGAYAVATAVVFVGSDPFRATFVGDAMGNGAPEVYLTDFAAAPQVLSAATQGNARLQGYATAANGATIVYRSEDPAAPATNSLSFVQSSNPSQQNAIALPSGVTPVQNPQGKDQFQVSPDGQWIAVIAGQGSTAGLYVVSVASPATVTQVIPTGTVYASMPRFSQDSKNLYFLASVAAGGANKSVYLVTLSNLAATAVISGISAPGTSDDVSDFSVSQDQSRILIEANRGGVVGLYYINPQQLQTELRVSEQLGPSESIRETTMDLTPGLGGSSSGAQVAYNVQSSILGPIVAQVDSVYVADVSATPGPRMVATNGARVIGFRPDDNGLLYSENSQVIEADLTSQNPDAPVGDGVLGWYDSTGNIVLLEQLLPSGGTPAYYPALATTVRGSFGTTQPVGTTSMAAQYVNVTGYGAGVALLGQGPTTGTAPTSVQLALVNVLAPATLFNLASFQSPLQLTSDIAQVVTY